MTYQVERAVEADRDLEAIFDFLVQSYLSVGDPVNQAFDRAAARIAAIEDAMESLSELPHRGASRSDLAPGVRTLTRGGAILYFEVSDDRKFLRILAIFLGGQDHQRTLLIRISSDSTSSRGDR